MEYKDYCKTRSVNRVVSADEPKEACYKFPPKYHPDVNKEVHGAHGVFKDPEMRQVYNELGNNWLAGHELRPSH